MPNAAFIRLLTLCSVFSIVALMLVSCSSLENAYSSTRPQWIDNPGDGVSASAGTNIYGKHAQEELAIARAREEFARRFGVRVVSDQDLSMKVVNSTASVESYDKGSVSLDVENVRAQVKSKWYDTNNDILWVWLVPVPN